MSNKPKKYPADTPVTLQMIVEFHEAYGATSLADRWRRFIEPPKPEPKEGELWLCKTDIDHKAAFWRISGGWTFWGDSEAKYGPDLTPIKRLIPPEDEA